LASACADSRSEGSILGAKLSYLEIKTTRDDVLVRFTKV
jgi:hypothetical protein